MEEYWTPVEELIWKKIPLRKFDYFWEWDSNCYGVIFAWLNNDPNKLWLLDKSVLYGLESTQKYEILHKDIKLQLFELLDKWNDTKIREFYKEHNNEILSYMKIIRGFLRKHKDKIIIIEFLDWKDYSQHVAFIKPDMTIYDKVCTWKFNLWYNIRDMFKYWYKWSRSYRLYALDNEQTNNVQCYIDYLKHQLEIYNQKSVRNIR